MTREVDNLHIMVSFWVLNRMALFKDLYKMLLFRCVDRVVLFKGLSSSKDLSIMVLVKRGGNEYY